ncbi:MAG: hypothetical protein JNL79_15675 [Myxococcales bacterium]|nr:hypothetical protein [Myxococcales bacterium]
MRRSDFFVSVLLAGCSTATDPGETAKDSSVEASADTGSSIDTGGTTDSAKDSGAVDAADTGAEAGDSGCADLSCSGVCVDGKTDPDHCGSCANKCRPPRAAPTASASRA